MSLSILVALALGAAQSAGAVDLRDPARDAARLLGAAIRGEPRIEAVQRAAEARAGPAREETESWARRARLAALLPRLSADFRHDERSYRVVGLTSTAEVDYLRAMPGDTLGVRVTWNLGSLVFAHAELDAAAAAERAASHRRTAVDRATHLYFERQRLRLALAASPPASARERAERELEIDEITAQLDALTGLYGEGSP